MDVFFELVRVDPPVENHAPRPPSTRIKKLWDEWYVFKMTGFNYSYNCRHRTRQQARNCAKKGGC